MIEINSLWLMLLGELAVVFLLGCLAFIYLAMRRKSQDRKAAYTLAAAVKRGEQHRIEEIRKWLESRYQYQNEALDKMVDDLVKGEREFYQTLIDLYLQRDASALVKVNVVVEKLTDLYRSLKLPQTSVVENTGNGDDTDAKTTSLREENKRLTEELRVTMDSIGRMLHEYSTMFGGGADTAVDTKKLMAMFEGHENNEKEHEEDSVRVEIPGSKAESQSQLDLDAESEKTVSQLDDIAVDLDIDSNNETQESSDAVLEDMALLEDMKQFAEDGEDPGDVGRDDDRLPG